MLSATFAVAVRLLRAMTVIMPSLTTKWPEIVLPFASLKLSFFIFLPIPWAWLGSQLLGN